jgi:hypothetical protein
MFAEYHRGFGRYFAYKCGNSKHIKIKNGGVLVPNLSNYDYMFYNYDGRLKYPHAKLIWSVDGNKYIQPTGLGMRYNWNGELLDQKIYNSNASINRFLIKMWSGKQISDPKGLLNDKCVAFDSGIMIIEDHIGSCRTYNVVRCVFEVKSIKFIITSSNLMGPNAKYCARILPSKNIEICEPRYHEPYHIHKVDLSGYYEQHLVFPDF